MRKRSKRYRLLNKEENILSIVDAVDFLKKEENSCKFDETVEVCFNLNLLKKHTIRDTISFIHSFGKTNKVLVFAKGSKAEEAKQAGADYVGADDLIEKINGGWLDCDVTVATPDMMKSVARIARVLGTKGLMPNPKAKTVTENVSQAVKELKAGRREFRANDDGVINFAVGKKSMETNQILGNINDFYSILLKKKPSDLKGDYIDSVYLTTTMGKSLQIDRKTMGQ